MVVALANPVAQEVVRTARARDDETLVALRFLVYAAQQYDVRIAAPEQVQRRDGRDEVWQTSGEAKMPGPKALGAPNGRHKCLLCPPNDPNRRRFTAAECADPWQFVRFGVCTRFAHARCVRLVDPDGLRAGQACYTCVGCRNHTSAIVPGDDLPEALQLVVGGAAAGSNEERGAGTRAAGREYATHVQLQSVAVRLRCAARGV